MVTSSDARRLRRPLRASAAVALATALLLAGCSSDDEDAAPAPGPSKTAASTPPDPALKEYYSQDLRWKDCGGGFDCATLRVPLDYDRPDGKAIDVAVTRLPASDEKERVGSLLINPGGPGASGIDYARAAEDVITDDVRERFDVIGFDPRGVGQSTPVECFTDRQTDTITSAEGSPDTAAEERALVDLAKSMGESCEKGAGELLPHVGTRDVARDMDVLRAVLGDDRLNFLGKSYGTYLGTTYAELFPGNVGRLVLDGAIDPSLDGEEFARGQAGGFQQALEAFAADCAGRDCPVDGGADDVVTAVENLLDRLDSRPLPTQDGRQLTQSLGLLGVAAGLYDEQYGWPYLRDALDQAFAGDGSGLLALADFYTDRRDDGTYSSNQLDANLAINCLDWGGEGGAAEMRRIGADLDDVSPVFGEYLAWGSAPCSYWPVDPEASPHEAEAPGAAPILVVGTTNDPATPYAWAESLAGQLDSGTLLTYEGDGHTAYAQGSSCVDEAVERYLIHGEVPKEGTRCG